MDILLKDFPIFVDLLSQGTVHLPPNYLSSVRQPLAKRQISSNIMTPLIFSLTGFVVNKFLGMCCLFSGFQKRLKLKLFSLEIL